MNSASRGRCDVLVQRRWETYTVFLSTLAIFTAETGFAAAARLRRIFDIPT